MPNTTIEDAVSVLQRLADRVRFIRVEDVPAQLQITFSAGVVQRSPLEKIEDTVRRADRAMYSAKENGRARINSDTPINQVRCTHTSK